MNGVVVGNRIRQGVFWGIASAGTVSPHLSFALYGNRRRTISFHVAVSFGERMKVACDTRGELTFRIEAAPCSPPAKFDFTMAEQHFGCELRCAVRA
jgi:hypothetical protein